ncbi:MAG TPA: transporter [Woeseiaceae bacterium]|nr:transporter [Woeseiaceae bacterium]
MVCTDARLLAAGAALLASSVAAAENLDTLIPGLYGGDGITLAGADGGPFPSHAPHFLVASADSFNRLNDIISAQIGAIPFASSGAGFAFRYDEDLGTFVQVAQSFGPIYAERAETIGKGRFNANLSFTAFKYDEFLGDDLDRFMVTTLHDADTIPPDDEHSSFELDTVVINLNLDINVNALVFAGTYGLTDRLDVGFLVPLADIDLRVDARAEVVKSPDNMIPVDVHTFEGGPESPSDSARGTATGLGDIVLRAKYHWLQSETNNVAAAVQVKTATGDDEDFLGTGDNTVRPLLIYSRSFGSFTPHMNLGYEFNLDDSDQNSLEYAAGFDFGAESYTLALSILGSREMSGDGIADTIVNGAFGVKWNPFGSYILTANVLVPLNDDGLRSDVISTLAFERNF